MLLSTAHEHRMHTCPAKLHIITNKFITGHTTYLVVVESAACSHHSQHNSSQVAHVVHVMRLCRSGQEGAHDVPVQVHRGRNQGVRHGFYCVVKRGELWGQEGREDALKGRIRRGCHVNTCKACLQHGHSTLRLLFPVLNNWNWSDTACDGHPENAQKPLHAAWLLTLRCLSAPKYIGFATLKNPAVHRCVALEPGRILNMSGFSMLEW